MPQPTTTTTTPPPSLPPQLISPQHQELISRTAWKAGMMGTMATASAILSQRLIVLVSAVGGIGLTWLALQSPDAYKLGALAIFCVGVVIPAVVLARG